MTYSIYIDQTFAERHGMTLVEVSNLASIITLPTWSETIAIEGKVWYKYSERKLAQDYPLLYGNEGRCYKNLHTLADKGYIELSKFGKDKYLRFLPVCEEWGRGKEIAETEKDQKRNISPKTEKLSENGEKDQKRRDFSPKTDSPNILLNNYNYIINSSSSLASAHARMREWVGDNVEQMQIMAKRNNLTTDLDDTDALFEIYDQYIRVFIEDEQVRDEIGRELRNDVKKHFWNWLPKYINTIKTNNDETNEATRENKRSTTRGAIAVASDADYWDV